MTRMWYDAFKEAGRQDDSTKLATLTRPTELAADRADHNIARGRSTVNCQARVGRLCLPGRCHNGQRQFSASGGGLGMGLLPR
jgi:hypothetical protein